MKIMGPFWTILAAPASSFENCPAIFFNFTMHLSPISRKYHRHNPLPKETHRTIIRWFCRINNTHISQTDLNPTPSFYCCTVICELIRHTHYSCE
uniref:Putative secreted protein n=1 Tax=Anopheles marajoara TaxID=58244 RepID=A0A2M4C9V3_9DIPT